MAFDLATAKPATKPAVAGSFDLSSAKRVQDPAATERMQANARAAFERSRTSPEQVAARRADEAALSLGGRITGTLREIGSDFADTNFGLDYLKDYGKGIATALEQTDELIDPGELLLGVGAPAITYPLAMGAGALAAPFSGDYGGIRDAAFENLNSVLPEGAKAAQGVIGSLIKPVGDVLHTAGQGLGDIAGVAGLPEQGQQNVADISEDVLGFMGVKGKAPKGTPLINEGPPVRAPVTPGVTADPVARARDAGYKIAPSARTAEGKSAAPIGGMAEGVSGRTQMQHRVDQFNDQRVLEGIRKDLGLPAKAAITKPAIDAIMNETSLAYKAVTEALPALQQTPALLEAIGGIGAKRKTNPYLKETPAVARLRQRLADAGTVETDKVLSAIEEFRADARLLQQSAEKPEALQRAKASRAAADVLENALDEALTQQGRGDLVPSLKNARMRRAKAHQALEAVSGKKRPGVALMDMKLAGEKLSGEMELAADVMRDMSPNGPLHVNMAHGAGNAPGDITGLLQGVVRPLIQPALTSEFGQARMFGPRVPESLSVYTPDQFDVPPAVPQYLNQDQLLGPGVDLAPPAGTAGGAMPSDVRRLRSTIGPQAEAIGPLLDLEGQPGLPGRLMPSDERRLARTTEQQNQIRMQDFILEPPPGEVGLRGPAALSERELLDLELAPGFAEMERRSPTPAPYTGIERRVNGVPDLSAERQRVLERPIGEAPNRGIADAILADPELAAAVREDTLRNREAIAPPAAEATPAGLDAAAAAYTRMMNEEIALAMDEIESAQRKNPNAGRLTGERYEQIKRMTDPEEQLAALDELLQDLEAPKTAADLARDLAALRETRPRPLHKMYGQNPTPEQRAAHAKAVSEWSSKYRKLQKAHKEQLEREQ